MPLSYSLIATKYPVSFVNAGKYCLSAKLSRARPECLIQKAGHSQIFLVVRLCPRELRLLHLRFRRFQFQGNQFQKRHFWYHQQLILTSLSVCGLYFVSQQFFVPQACWPGWLAFVLKSALLREDFILSLESVWWLPPCSRRRIRLREVHHFCSWAQNCH